MTVTLVVHKDRYSFSGVSLRKLRLVLHTAQGGESNLSLRNLRSIFTLPGDRVIAGSNPPRRYGSAYTALPHYLHPETFEEILTDDKGPYAAPPTNKDSLHFVFPGLASQSREDWLKDLSNIYITAAARYAVEVALGRHGIPMVQLNSSQLLAGDRGVCDHLAVTNAWHDTNHTDVGPGFPWDVFWARVASLMPQPPQPEPIPPEDQMSIVIQPDDGDDAIFVVTGPIATHLRDFKHADVLKVLRQLPVSTDATHPEKVPRSVLKALTCPGGVVYPASYTGKRTVASDFQAQVL